MSWAIEHRLPLANEMGATTDVVNNIFKPS